MAEAAAATSGYQPDWDFYLAKVDGAPASIYVDLGLAKIAQ